MSISASERGKLELDTFEALEREVHGVLRARLIEQVALLALLQAALGDRPPAPVRGRYTHSYPENLQAAARALAYRR